MDRKTKPIGRACLAILLLALVTANCAPGLRFSIIPALAPAPAGIRVACVGDSITWGFGLVTWLQSYPVVLDGYLGPGWEVGNFGKNSATLLRNGDLPYVKTPEYLQSLEFQPDLVVIMLGTNDTKPHNQVFQEAFEPDYLELIASYRALPSHPLILVAIPPWIPGEGFWGISDQTLNRHIIPAISRVWAEAAVSGINLYAVTRGHPEYYLPDMVHPNALGAQVIARAMAGVLATLEARLPVR